MTTLTRLLTQTTVADSASVPSVTGRRRGGLVVFLLSALLYLGFALWLALDVQFYFGDALARTQSAQSVLYSRNPGLVVMGFVFTPLTTLAQLPLVALTPLIPQMSSAGLAGALTSVFFMAGAVLQVWQLAVERGLRLRWATVFTLLFALNPMILLYSAVGMSEAPFLFATLWAARTLARWSRTDDVHDLVFAGIALSLAFLARYDAVIMAFFAGIAVFLYTWLGRPGPRRFGFGVIDMAVLVAPALVAFVFWVAADWLFTGEFLSQFTSDYGNSAILAQSGATARGVDQLGEALIRAFLVAPVLPLLVVITLVLSRRRRDPETMFPLIMMLAVLFFQIISYSLGSTFGMLRFFMIGIALQMILAIHCFPPRYQFPSRRPGRAYRLRRVAVSHRPWGVAVLVVLLLLGNVITLRTMASQKWAPQEFALAELVPFAPEVDPEMRHLRQALLRTYQTEQDIADYLDDLELGEGEVLVSTIHGYPILTASRNQKQFTIQSDDDFVIKLNNLWQGGVRYVLTVPDDQRGANDPLNVRYEDIFETGSVVGTLEAAWSNSGSGQPDWHLYQVFSTTPPDYR